MDSTAVHQARSQYSPTQNVFDLLDLVVFLTKRLQVADQITDELNNAVLFELAVADDFGSKEQNKEKKGLVGDFKAKDGKHGSKGLAVNCVCKFGEGFKAQVSLFDIIGTTKGG